MAVCDPSSSAAAQPQPQPRAPSHGLLPVREKDEKTQDAGCPGV